MSTPALELSEVTYDYGALRAVDMVTLSVPERTLTAVIGPNGAGKSTLMHTISGFYRPTGGVVRVRGRDIRRKPPWKLAAMGMGRTFQDLEIFDRLTVAENVALGLAGQGAGTTLGLLRRMKPESRRADAEIERILARVGLAEAADRMAAELSYAEQKLVIIARLIATESDLLLLDEPGAGLARDSIDAVGRSLRGLVDEGRTVILVDHNMRLIFQYCDYVYVMHHGKLLAAGEPDRIRQDPEVMRVYLSGGDADDDD